MTLKVNQEGSWAAAERTATEELDQRGHGGDDGADLDHEHDRVADLDSGVETHGTTRGSPGGGSRDRTVSGLASRWSFQRCFLVEGDVELEDVDAGLAEDAEGSGRRCLRRSGHRGGRRELRTAAMRCAWIRALASEISGSTPEPDWKDSRRPGRFPWSASGRNGFSSVEIVLQVSPHHFTLFDAVGAEIEEVGGVGARIPSARAAAGSRRDRAPALLRLLRRAPARRPCRSPAWRIPADQARADDFAVEP